MVTLALTPHRNANHARFFPHAGYLGLTPVVLQGTVRTSLQEDNRALKARSVVIRVRCYEADVSTSKGKKKKPRVVYELSQVVWSGGGEGQWGMLGDWSKGWKLVVPVEAGGCTTSTFKTWRSWWKVEAVVYHKPSAILGFRTIASHQVPLTRYSASTVYLPPPTWSSHYSLSPFPHYKPPTPPPTIRGLQYSVSGSSGVFGPNDPIRVSFLFTRDDPSISIKRIQVSLERHLIVDVDASSPPRSDDDEVFVLEDDSVYSSLLNYEHGRRGRPSAKSPWQRRSSSAAPLIPPSPVWSGEAGSYFAPRVMSSHPNGSPGAASSVRTMTPILAFEAEGDVAFDTEFVLAGVVPKAKSQFVYSIGETLHTNLVNMSFTVSVKITVKTRNGGTEIVELEPRPVIITSASNGERETALSQSGKLLLAMGNPESRRIVDVHSPSPSPVPIPAPAPITPLLFPTPAPHRLSALGTRRTSGFSLTVGTGEEPLAPDDLVSPLSPPRNLRSPRSFTRKRSDQWDAVEAPVKSKVRLSRGIDSPRLDNQPFATNASGLEVPSSPALSDNSTSTCSTPSLPPSPSLAFHIFPLTGRLPESLRYDRATRSKIAPWEVDELSPFDQPRGATRAEIAPWEVEDIGPFDFPGTHDVLSPKGPSRLASAPRQVPFPLPRPIPPRSSSPPGRSTLAFGPYSLPSAAAFPSAPTYPGGSGDVRRRRISADSVLSASGLGAPPDPSTYPPRRKSNAGLGRFGKATGQEDESGGPRGGWWSRRGSKS